jgi:hypothetical protein
MPPSSIVHRPTEVEINDLRAVGEGTGGTLEIDGRRIFLYIREFHAKAASFDDAVENPELLRKFHVAWCDVLIRMKQQNRFERYVGSERVDEPFGIALKLPDDRWACGDAGLLVCRVCLAKINWRGFSAENRSGKTKIVTEFSRRDFLQTATPNFAEKPRKFDTSPPSMGYASDWAERSKAHRSFAGWRCQQCGVDCGTHKNLLDTHHLNGDTGDNQSSNLRALCKICHSAEHPGWYKVSSADRQKIETLRKQQGR